MPRQGQLFTLLLLTVLGEVNGGANFLFWGNQARNPGNSPIVSHQSESQFSATRKWIPGLGRTSANNDLDVETMEPLSDTDTLPEDDVQDPPAVTTTSSTQFRRSLEKSDDTSLHDDDTPSHQTKPRRLRQFSRYHKWRLQSIHRGATKFASETIAGIGFASSLTLNLVTARAQFQRLQPTVVALQTYLKETGITQEIKKSVSAKLYDNVVILWRIQRDYRATHDVRDLVLLDRKVALPDMEEASR